MRDRRTPVAGPILLLAGVVLLLPCGCGGGGSGGGGATVELALLSATTGSGFALDQDSLFLNESLRFTFNVPLDPDSIHPDSVQIRDEGGGAVPAVGDFLVDGGTLVFTPRLPLAEDLSDAGLAPDRTYRILLPGAETFDAIRSVGGGRLPEAVTLRFQTRGGAPFLLDEFPGPPRVTGFLVDLDRDGSFLADGDPGTVDDEEFFDLDTVPLLTGAPVGLARAPLAAAFVMSEPLFPGSVLRDADGDGRPDLIRLTDLTTGADVPFRLAFTQGFESGRLLVLLTVIPESTLPPLSRLRVTLDDAVRDFSLTGPTTPFPGIEFETRGGPAAFDDALLETFDDRLQRDPATSAEWNTADSGVLTSGLGITGLGGSGEDGPLVLLPGESITLNTNENDGVFQFQEVRIPVGATLLTRGPNPLRLLAAGDMTIEGSIVVDGSDGLPGIRRADRAIAGGEAGPGGFPGGAANEPPWDSPNGGQFRNPLESAQPGDAPELHRVSGGQPGNREATVPGGGGGGGHAFEGGTCFASSIYCGMGGTAFGDETLEFLLGGSGGGGGGNHGVKFGGRNDFTGGSGGGGGGAISLECSRMLTITGTISAGGGDGGIGAPGRDLNKPGGAGGGGGAGGAIRIRTFELAPVVGDAASLTALGGTGGTGGGFGAQPGASGSVGRIRVEAFDANGDGLANDFVIDRNRVNVAPLETRGILVSDGTSVALSRFRDTGAASPRYSFDGSDPATGLAREAAGVDDLKFAGPIPIGATVHVEFQGALENAGQPRQPDLDATTDWTTRIEDLDGFRFVRYRITFDVGDDPGGTRPVVVRLRIRFSFEI